MERSCKETVGWLGFAATFTGSAIQAFFPASARFAFPVFVAAAAIWAAYAHINRDRPLFFQSLGLVVIDIIAVIHWFT
jgi:hypothetical protein